MTLTVVLLALLAWIGVAVVLAFGLGALVARHAMVSRHELEVARRVTMPAPRPMRQHAAA